MWVAFMASTVLIAVKAGKLYLKIGDFDLLLAESSVYFAQKIVRLSVGCATLNGV
ncbi:hypothetical protein HP532_09085 [Pseudomonas sp. CrR25]|nr:hypothetical protein [Pseudomonas sp. CrR25]